MKELRPSRPRSTDSRRKLPPPSPRRRRYAPSGVSKSAAIAVVGVIGNERGLSRGLVGTRCPDDSGSSRQRNNAREDVERGLHLDGPDGERRGEANHVLAG